MCPLYVYMQMYDCICVPNTEGKEALHETETTEHIAAAFVPPSDAIGAPGNSRDVDAIKVSNILRTSGHSIRTATY